MDSSALTLKIQMASAIVALLLVIVTVVYTFATRRMAAEMRKQTEIALAAAEAARASAEASQDAATEMKLSRVAEFAPRIVGDVVTLDPISGQGTFVFKNVGRDVAQNIFVYIGVGSKDANKYRFFYDSPVEKRLFLTPTPDDTIHVEQRHFDEFSRRHAEIWEEDWYPFFVEFVYNDVFGYTYRSVVECGTALGMRPGDERHLTNRVWRILSKEEVTERREWHGLVQREQL